MILEEILAQVGNSGRFQVMFSAIIFTMEVIIAWSMLQAAIVGATPKWWCVAPSSLDSPDNFTVTNLTLQTCSPSSPSASSSSSNSSSYSSFSSDGNGPGDTVSYDATTSKPSIPGSCVRYYDPSLVTIVSEWDLVCERKHIKALINSVQMAGVLVGAVVSGQASDTVGRRLTCYLTMLLHAVTCLLAGLSTTWQMFAACRFFVGGAIGSYLVMHYVYNVEFVKHTWRPYLASIPAWAFGAGLMCLTAWQLPHWRYLHYVCAALSFPMLLGWFVSPESVRWLAAKGRIEAAEQVVDKIARINGRTMAPDTSEQLALLAEEEKAYGGTQQKYAYHTLCCGWKNASKTLILAFTWMTLSMSFYGIIFGVSALSGNVFLNMFLLSVAEVPLTVFTSVLIIRFGRRWIGCLWFVLASITAFGILIADRTASLESKGTIISVVAITSKLFIASAWCCMQTFTVELYPTVIRSLGVGAANTAARVGGILAPFVLEMDTSDDAVKCYVIVGSMMAISGFLVLLLKETKGKTLADTLHQDQKELDL